MFNLPIHLCYFVGTRYQQPHTRTTYSAIENSLRTAVHARSLRESWYFCIPRIPADRYQVATKGWGVVCLYPL